MVLSLSRLRRRLPLIASILLVLVCLLAVGAACACTSDHPGQAIERVLASVPAALPAPVELWSLLIVALAAPSVLLRRRTLAFGRASPSVLQRFLF